MAPVVLLAVVWTSGARAGRADTTDRALVADWKDGDREMAAAAEIIASAFANGMSWAGTIEGRPLSCPPPLPGDATRCRRVARARLSFCHITRRARCPAAPRHRLRIALNTANGVAGMSM